MMPPRPAIAPIGELETILSSTKADLTSAASFPELEISGRRIRLFFVRETQAAITDWPALKAKAQRVATALARVDATPVLVTTLAASPLAAVLQDAGWAILREGSNEIVPGGPPADMADRKIQGFGSRKLTLLCALWHLRNESFEASQLGAAAGVSATAARSAISDAVQLGWLVPQARGRSHRYAVDNSQAIIDTVKTTAAAASPRWQHYAVPADALTSLPQRLDGFCRTHDIGYAITGRYAASYYLGRRGDVPELQIRLSPSVDIADLLAHLRAAPVKAPGNLAIVISADAASWLHARRAHGLDLANPLIVLCDLLSLGSPAAEAIEAWLRSSECASDGG